MLAAITPVMRVIQTIVNAIIACDLSLPDMQCTVLVAHIYHSIIIHEGEMGLPTVSDILSRVHRHDRYVALRILEIVKAIVNQLTFACKAGRDRHGRVHEIFNLQSLIAPAIAKHIPCNHVITLGVPASWLR